MGKNAGTIEDLMEIFKDYVDEDDILSAKILSKISSKIVSFRIENNMSQVQFAKFLGVSQAMVSKIESSEYNFTIKNLVRICNKMNLHLDVNIKDDFIITSDQYNYIKCEIGKEYSGYKKEYNVNSYSIKNNIKTKQKWLA